MSKDGRGSSLVDVPRPSFSMNYPILEESMHMSRKIVVTGLGATTPIGGDVSTTWNNALNGVSGIKQLDKDWVERYELPVYIAGQAATAPLDSGRLTKVEAKRQDPSAQFALVAAREAWEDAGFSADNAEDAQGLTPERVGVAFGTGIGGVWTLLDSWDTLREKGPRRVLPLTVPMLMPNSCAAAVSMALNARAAAQTVVSACASSTEAMSLAVEMIRSGKADVVIAGGAEAAIHPLPLAAFAKMQALSTRNDDPVSASRPYDVDRDGFVMSEGGAALILESEEHARARGARIYAELAGTGVSADSYHITSPDPEALGAVRALNQALADGNIDAEQVVHVNAHATSTPVGDVPESSALHQVFGDHTKHIAVSATKSMTGHLLGAAGALEAVLTVLAVFHRKAPCTINLEHQDPQIDLDVVTEARDLPAGKITALSNSFGFGGHNAVVAFRSIEE